MKLNFWQWVGVGLLILGVILIIARRANHADLPPATQPVTTEAR